jgi:hypothetical protein
MEEAGSGRGFQSQHTVRMQVLSGSQVTPGLSMSMRIRPICKDLHTYIIWPEHMSEMFFSGYIPQQLM